MVGKKSTYYLKLTDRNKKAIDKYIKNYTSETTRDKKVIGVTKSYLTKILFLIKIDYDKITYDDFEEISPHFAETTWETSKTKFRAFLKYHNRNKIADKIKININKLQQHKILEEDSLTKEEINKLIESAEELYDKALIESYIVSGGRNTEIARLKIKDITEEIQYIKFEINKRRKNTNKSKTRNIYIVTNPNNPVAIYPKNLINFLHNHKYKNNRDAYVFYSTSDKAENKDKHISSGNVWKKIKIITKNSKIHKNIFPHLIRHTSASFDGLVLPITLFCEKYGWSKDSPEVERYCEPSEEMKIDFLLKKAGVNPEEVNMCPRCNETNTLNSERCKKCNTILGKELVLHLENKLHQQDNLITKLTKQNDLIIKLEEKIKDITKDTSDKLDKISKSTKYIFYMSNLNVKIRYNKFITKNPKHTKKQMREYLNKDFLEFQDSKEYQLQLNLLEHLLIII